MKLDDTLCYCFHVPKRKIRNFLKVHRPKRASQLSECGGAGTGCGWCVPYLKRCFEEFQTSGDLGQDEIQVSEYSSGRQAHIQAGKGKPPAGARNSGNPPE
jgi:NAD(P)H-nitrite reductase large subunit